MTNKRDVSLDGGTPKTNPKSGISYLELFLTFLKINTVTFGGGYTIVPVIRDEFMKKKGLIEEEEMLDIVALGQSGPGPMAISTSLLTGYRVKGPLGAIVSLVASVIPCLIIISTLYYVYDAFSSNQWVKAALDVMAGAISAVLVVTTFNMGKAALKKHPIFGAILLGSAFVASYFFDVHTGLVILIAGIIGLVTFSICKEEEVR